MERAMDKVKYIQRIRRPNGVVDLYFRKGDHREGPCSHSMGLQN